MSEPRGPCDQGYYCPEGQNVSSPDAFICTPGHYCPTGSPALVACEPGSYQDLFGRVCILLHMHFCVKILLTNYQGKFYII